MNGARWKDLRKQAGMTQGELATKLGVSTSAIGMYEQGRRTPDHACLSKAAKLFGVSSDYLLDLTDAPTPTADADQLAADIFSSLMQQEALMFQAERLGEEDYQSIANAVRMAVDIAMEKHRQGQKE